MILMRLALAEITINPASRRIQDASGSGPAHRFDDIIGEERTLIKVNLRLCRGSCDIRVRGQVDDDVVPLHRLYKLVQIAGIAAHDAQSPIAAMRGDVPISARGEIIEQSDRCNLRVIDQMISEVAADKARTADDKISRAEIRSRRNVSHQHRL